MIDIITASYVFCCPVCGTKVRKGDIALVIDKRIVTCTCQMPVRRLRKIETQPK